MNRAQSEFDQRQYRLMLDRLNAFIEGRLPIDTLINDLEGLLNILDGVQPSWRQTFLQHWGKLEDERAVSLFRSSEVLDEQATRRTRDAAAQLKLMVLEKIDESGA
jgi:hypothetical protein